MKNRDFIFVSLNPWYTPLSSTSKHVALELAKQNRVLYVNPPLDRKTILTRKNDPLLKYHFSVINKEAEELVEISPGLWNYYPRTVIESVNWVPNTRIFSWLNLINNKRFASAIRHAAGRLGFSDFILMNDKDLFRSFYLKELLRPEIYLYYDRDYILSVDYWKKHGTALEPELARKSDLIVTHSDYLMELMLPYNKNIYNVGSGIDVSLFDAGKTYEKPRGLESLHGPVLGYVGALSALRLDHEALLKIAGAKPEWNLVFVGPEDETFRRSPLHSLPNVFFCGRKKLEEIPAYIAHMDVCLNPQVINEITIGNYPLKIDEYLAMGKPVVATRTRGMKLFEPYTYLGEPSGDYVPLVEKALQEKDEEEKTKRRIAFARSHSWENILNNIYRALETTMNRKNGYSS